MAAPGDSDWTLAGQTAKKSGKRLVVRHRLKAGRARQLHEYQLNIDSLSMAVYESTLLYKTFPFNIPHSHRITEGGAVTYDRGIEEWGRHVEQKGLLEDSSVRLRQCEGCAAEYYDTSTQVLCLRCHGAAQSIARRRALALCKQAEKLADSSDWKATAELVKRLQQEWRQLPPLPRDASEKLWQRFQKATQQFFDARSRCFESRDQQRRANRKKAEALIRKARRATAGKDRSRAVAELKALQKAWKDVNPLPREVADELWQRFRGICDEFFGSR